MIVNVMNITTAFFPLLRGIYTCVYMGLLHASGPREPGVWSSHLHTQNFPASQLAFAFYLH